jgi:hypothetical protein
VYVLSTCSLVDEDSFLHTESDPRYRGAAIPSRAFRMLQNMTDGSADYSEQGMAASVWHVCVCVTLC